MGSFNGKLRDELEALEQAIIEWLAHQRESVRKEQRFADLLRHTRDQTLLLVGFWRGFRSDKLARLEIEQIEAVAGEDQRCCEQY